MIVRILGEAQYEVPEALLAELEKDDDRLNAAIEASDEAAFAETLQSLISSVRRSGQQLDPGTIVPSDLTIPHEGSTLADVQALLASEPDETDTVSEGA